MMYVSHIFNYVKLPQRINIMSSPKVLMLSSIILFSINSHADVSTNAFALALIVQPLQNQNLSSYGPVPDGSAVGYQSNGCILNGGDGCFYTRSTASGSVGSNISLGLLVWVM